MAAIGKLTQLEELHLNFGRFSDAGVKQLAGLSRLKRLSLSHTKLTNAAMDIVGSLTTLEALDLDHATITDAGLAEADRTLTKLADARARQRRRSATPRVAHLSALGALRQLDLYHTLRHRQRVRAAESGAAALPRSSTIAESTKRERRS